MDDSHTLGFVDLISVYILIFECFCAVIKTDIRGIFSQSTSHCFSRIFHESTNRSNIHWLGPLKNLSRDFSRSFRRCRNSAKSSLIFIKKQRLNRDLPRQRIKCWLKWIVKRSWIVWSIIITLINWSHPYLLNHGIMNDMTSPLANCTFNRLTPSFPGPGVSYLRGLAQVPRYGRVSWLAAWSCPMIVWMVIH